MEEALDEISLTGASVEEEDECQKYDHGRGEYCCALSALALTGASVDDSLCSVWCFLSVLV